MVRDIVHLTYIEYGVYGDLNMMYPKPYSIHFRVAIMYLLGWGM